MIIESNVSTQFSEDIEKLKADIAKHYFILLSPTYGAFSESILLNPLIGELSPPTKIEKYFEIPPGWAKMDTTNGEITFRRIANVDATGILLGGQVEQRITIPVIKVSSSQPISDINSFANISFAFFPYDKEEDQKLKQYTLAPLFPLTNEELRFGFLASDCYILNSVLFNKNRYVIKRKVVGSKYCPVHPNCVLTSLHSLQRYFRDTTNSMIRDLLNEKRNNEISKEYLLFLNMLEKLIDAHHLEELKLYKISFETDNPLEYSISLSVSTKIRGNDVENFSSIVLSNSNDYDALVISIALILPDNKKAYIYPSTITRFVHTSSIYMKLRLLPFIIAALHNLHLEILILSNEIFGENRGVIPNVRTPWNEEEHPFSLADLFYYLNRDKILTEEIIYKACDKYHIDKTRIVERAKNANKTLVEYVIENIGTLSFRRINMTLKDLLELAVYVAGRSIVRQTMFFTRMFKTVLAAEKDTINIIAERIRRPLTNNEEKIKEKIYSIDSLL